DWSSDVCSSDLQLSSPFEIFRLPSRSVSLHQRGSHARLIIEQSRDMSRVIEVMKHSSIRAAAIVPEKIQRLQRALFATRLSQNLSRFEISADGLGIGIGVDTVVDDRKIFSV